MGRLAKRFSSALNEADEGDCGCGCEGAGDCGEGTTEERPHRYVFSSEKKRTEWLEMRLAMLLEGTHSSVD